MITGTLCAEKDPMGAAIRDYFTTGKAEKLRVFSSQFDEDEIPVKELFREYIRMPEIEKKALEMASGRILDLGAGSGCHSLELQKMGKEVTAIDISPFSVEIMKKRGVHEVQLVNFFDERFTGSFDTVLLLMNGLGIVGRIENLPVFFRKMKQIVAPGGTIWMDSSDLSYLYEEEDGSFVVNLAEEYYGQIDFRMQYKNITGDIFDWLYIDYETLKLYANENGFTAELIEKGKHYDYLAKLSVNK